MRNKTRADDRSQESKSSLFGCLDIEGKLTFLLSSNKGTVSFFPFRQSKVYVRTERQKEGAGEERNYKSSYKSENIKGENVALVIVHTCD